MRCLAESKGRRFAASAAAAAFFSFFSLLTRHQIRVKSDKSGVETNGVKMSANPFDDIALEEALRMKAKGIATEVIVVSVGDKKCQDTLRTSLAMGADRAVLVETDGQTQPLAVAKLLKALVAKEGAGLVVLGKQAIDGDNGQTGGILAGLLAWPQALCASKVRTRMCRFAVWPSLPLGGGGGGQGVAGSDARD